MSLSSARIVLLSALVSEECTLTELDRNNIHELMQALDELRMLQADSTPVSR